MHGILRALQYNRAKSELHKISLLYDILDLQQSSAHITVLTVWSFFEIPTHLVKVTGLKYKVEFVWPILIQPSVNVKVCASFILSCFGQMKSVTELTDLYFSLLNLVTLKPDGDTKVFVNVVAK